MDEPFTGLDPVNLVLLREAFTELRDRGRTLIFSTHQMEAAEALCESVAIVDHGRLVAGGRVRDLKRASGRRTLRLAVDGELGRRLACRPARCRRAPAGSWRVRPRTPARRRLGCDPGRGPRPRGNRCTRFEVVEPTLEALFIEHVGRPSDEGLEAGARWRGGVALGRRGRLMARQRPADAQRRDRRPARIPRPDAQPALPRVDGPSRDPGDDGGGRPDRDPLPGSADGDADRCRSRRTPTSASVRSPSPTNSSTCRPVASPIRPGSSPTRSRSPRPGSGPASCSGQGDLGGFLVVNRLPTGQVDIQYRTLEGPNSARSQILGVASFGIGVLDWSSRLPPGERIPFVDPELPGRVDQPPPPMARSRSTRSRRRAAASSASSSSCCCSSRS